MVCLLNSCLYVMFRSCFESLASVVTIKLVRAAHCGAPRIAAHRTYMGSCRKKMTGSFQILEWTLRGTHSDVSVRCRNTRKGRAREAGEAEKETRGNTTVSETDGREQHLADRATQSEHSHSLV